MQRHSNGYKLERHVEVQCVSFSKSVRTTGWASPPFINMYVQIWLNLLWVYCIILHKRLVSVFSHRFNSLSLFVLQYIPQKNTKLSKMHPKLRLCVDSNEISGFWVQLMYLGTFPEFKTLEEVMKTLLTQIMMSNIFSGCTSPCVQVASGW